MNQCHLIFLIVSMISFSSQARDRESKPTIRLFPGYISKISCDGKLVLSAVGNESMVRLEPLPSTLGCAVLIKPSTTSGRTNIILETSAGSIKATLDIRVGSPQPSDLEIRLKGDRT